MEAWLISSGRVLASAHVADSRRDRRRGLLGRSSFDGAFVLPRCRSVHSIGMRFDLDIAFLDQDGQVVKIAVLRRNRICSPARSASTLIEAERGAFDRWGLRVGDRLDIRAATDESSRR